MTFGRRLAKFRKSLGLGQEQLAALTNVKPRTYAGYERDETEPQVGFLAVIARLGGDPTYLVEGIKLPADVETALQGGMPVDNLAKWAAAAGTDVAEAAQRRALSAGRDVAEAAELRARTAILGRVPQAALDRPTSATVDLPVYRHSLAQESVKSRTIPFPRDIIARHLRRDAARLQVVFGKGDSMAPGISDDDMLIIDTDDTAVVTGRIYVLEAGDELLVIRLRVSPSGEKTMAPDNKIYPPEPFPTGGERHLRVAGRVVWRGHPMI